VLFAESQLKEKLSVSGLWWLDLSLLFFITIAGRNILNSPGKSTFGGMGYLKRISPIFIATLMRA